MIAKLFAALREGRLVVRSLLQRAWLRVACPSIRRYPAILIHAVASPVLANNGVHAYVTAKRIG